jgi:hypothetical protein
MKRGVVFLTIVCCLGGTGASRTSRRFSVDVLTLGFSQFCFQDFILAAVASGRTIGIGFLGLVGFGFVIEVRVYLSSKHIATCLSDNWLIS